MEILKNIFKIYPTAEVNIWIVLIYYQIAEGCWFEFFSVDKSKFELKYKL